METFRLALELFAEMVRMRCRMAKGLPPEGWFGPGKTP